MSTDGYHRHLAESDFIRQRQDPHPGDPHYLHLSDLLVSLKKYVSLPAAKILDFGCGGSPYRSLFPESSYARADVDGENLDFQISKSGTVPCPDQAFDLILSTQVLEHVPDSGAYLSEAFRLLRPGGTLLLSTHGTFYDHGCPDDFRRWTCGGLCADLEHAGFSVRSAEKLTTGARAVMFLGEDYLGSFWSSRKKLLGWGLWMFQKFFWSNRAARHRWMDAAFPRNRVVPGSDQHHSLYICLVTVSTRPQ